MRRRTSDTSTDSFELLLDAICNVFGGIILITIFVVLMTQTTAGNLPSGNAEEWQRALEGRKLAFDCLSLERRVDDMARQEALLQETYKAVESPNTQKLTDARQRFLDAIAEAERRLKAVHSDLSESKDGVTRSALQISRVARQTEDKIREIERLRTQLRSTPRVVERKVRLPHRRAQISGRPRYYLIKGGKVYPFKPYALGVGGEVSEHCLVTPLPKLGRGVVRVEPWKEGGITVPVDGRVSREVLASFSHCSPTTHTMFFFVCADGSGSFRAFQDLKRILLDQGYEYGVAAYSPKEQLILGPGRLYAQ